MPSFFRLNFPSSFDSLKLRLLSFLLEKGFISEPTISPSF